MSSGEKLERAIENRELGKFLLGEKPYYCDAGRAEEHDQPQNVSWAFDSQVLPYLQLPGKGDFLATIFAELERLLQACPDRNLAIYCAIDWIFNYCYARYQKQVEHNEFYSQLPETGLGELPSIVKQMLESNKGNMIADTRWAGERSNSPSGIWEPLMRVALSIRDKYHGPDFVPENR